LLPEGELPVRFANLQVFIAALRQFPSLSYDAPLQEKEKRKRNQDPPVEVIRGLIDRAYKSQFLRRAQLLGFRTENIVEGLRNATDLVVEAAEPFTEYSNGETEERRRGIPYTKAYKQFRTQLFLTNLSQFQAESSLNSSVLFNGIFLMHSLAGHLVAARTSRHQLRRFLSLSQRHPLSLCFLIPYRRRLLNQRCLLNRNLKYKPPILHVNSWYLLN
jgi:hypothetical protein